MFKVIVNLYGLGRYGHVVIDEDDMLSVGHKVLEKYGTKNYNIVSFHNTEPEEEPPVEEPVSRRITLFAVGSSFKDALARGHVRRSKESAEETLTELMREYPDKAWGIFGFDVYADETNNHWNA